MIRHSVKGGGGLELAVYETGNPQGPAILFIHGFCQCHLCWSRQFDGALAGEFRLIAMDLRGHGASAKPPEPENYADGGLWAADLAAVIETLELSKPVVVGWSYGGFVIGDYIRRHGDGALGAINFVGAGAVIGGDKGMEFIGPGLAENMAGLVSPETGETIGATRAFVAACSAAPLARDEFETVLAYNMLVPVGIRLGAMGRETDYGDTLATIAVPTLITHGAADTILLPSMADYIAARVSHGRLSLYEGAGHSPFLEDAARFDGELAALTREAGVN